MNEKVLIKNEGLFNTTSEKSCAMRVTVSVIMFVLGAYSIMRTICMFAEIGINSNKKYENGGKGIFARFFTESYPVINLTVGSSDAILDVQEYGIVDYIFAIAQALMFIATGVLVITGILNVTVSLPSIILFVIFLVLNIVMFFVREKLAGADWYRGGVKGGEHKNGLGIATRIIILLLYIIVPAIMILLSIRKKSALSLSK